MLLRAAAKIISIRSESADVQDVITEFGPAISYTDLIGRLSPGDNVLLNRTATELGLGTGGYDFVIARLNAQPAPHGSRSGHIVKLRYTPVQTAVTTLEEDPALASIWDQDLGAVPVVALQLHSQLPNAAAAAVVAGKKVVYIMTDSAALMAGFSSLITKLKQSGLIGAVITAGQAVGGDYEAVTLHSALLAARHYLSADIIIVGPGPGNAGTGTKYGFGSIEQAGILDTAAALGGNPIAAVRVSHADKRPRHNGISHHTITTMQLVRSACTIPIPAGMITSGFESRHNIVEVDVRPDSYMLLDKYNLSVTSMGRKRDDDPIFFAAAAAAGQWAAQEKDK